MNVQTLSAPTHTATAHVDVATADGTATVQGNDYRAAHGTLDFPPGFTTDTLAVSVIGDYVIEGLVPLDLVERMLKEKPAIKGLSLPGMPVGAIGMPGRGPRINAAFCCLFKVSP